MSDFEYSTRDLQTSLMRSQEAELHLKKEIERLSIKNFHIKNEKDRYIKLINELYETINTPGPVPMYHHHVLRKHRAEWPALWEKIDKILRIKND